MARVGSKPRSGTALERRAAGPPFPHHSRRRGGRHGTAAQHSCHRRPPPDRSRGSRAAHIPSLCDSHAPCVAASGCMSSRRNIAALARDARENERSIVRFSIALDVPRPATIFQRRMGGWFRAMDAHELLIRSSLRARSAHEFPPVVSASSGGSFFSTETIR